MITALPFGPGLIEGYYGRQWADAERAESIRFLAARGYRHYVYAPKGDRQLRGDWAGRWSDVDALRMRRLAAVCRDSGIAWGVGLSPLGLVENRSVANRDRLRDKIRYLDEFDVDILCILFDDMPRHIDALAAAQVEVVADVLAVTRARHVLVCPSYYSNDPALERLFGSRPPDYWGTLGRELPAEVGIFWTGERVCSTEYRCDELAPIAERFRRKPVLWDNYPVNDGAKISLFLHIDAFRARPAGLAQCVQAHFANPMNQCHLSRIPLASLAQLYREGDRYDPDAVFGRLAREIAGEAVGGMLVQDRDLLQRVGLGVMDDHAKAGLRQRYAGVDSPFAREVVAWLDGEYAFDPACLTD